MKKTFLFLAVFLYADVSNILLKINKIESYKPQFKKIKFIKCEKPAKKTASLNITANNNFELKLSAIFNKKALINNEWVKEGDFIKGYKVLKIYPKRVILKNENRITVLRFNNNLLKVKK